MSTWGLLPLDQTPQTLTLVKSTFHAPGRSGVDLGGGGARRRNMFPEATVPGCGSGGYRGSEEGGVLVLVRDVWRSVGLEQ